MSGLQHVEMRGLINKSVQDWHEGQHGLSNDIVTDPAAQLLMRLSVDTKFHSHRGLLCCAATIQAAREQIWLKEVHVHRGVFWQADIVRDTGGAKFHHVQPASLAL